MSVAFFDFDGTLTTHDTIWPFALFLSEAGRGHAGDRLRLALSLLRLKLRFSSNHAFKQDYARILLQGRDVKSIKALVERFHHERLTPLLNRQVRRALESHVVAGDAVYLVSSNFEFFLKPLEKPWGLSGVLATQAETADGLFTGRLSGRACEGPEKLSRAIDCLGESSVRASVAYGDSAGDKCLLGGVGTPVWVRKGYRFHPLDKDHFPNPAVHHL